MTDEPETTQPPRPRPRGAAPRDLPWYAQLQARRSFRTPGPEGGGSSLIGELWDARYAMQEWAVDRDPPPSIRWVWIWLLDLGLVVATRVAFPHAAWAGLCVLAAIFPLVALSTFYSLRSWSRPKPVEEARAVHHYHQARARQRYEEGDPEFAHYVPMSFASGLQASIVVNVAALIGVVGNYVMLALAQSDEDAALTVGFVTWGAIILLALFALSVGMLAWPRWPMPYVVREAARRGETVFTAEDYRAP